MTELKEEQLALIGSVRKNLLDHVSHLKILLENFCKENEIDERFFNGKSIKDLSISDTVHITGFLLKITK